MITPEISNTAKSILVNVNLICIYYIIGYAVFLLFTLPLAFIRARNHRNLFLSVHSDELVSSNLSIPVSIIAAALNEEAVIIPSVKSLLAQNYPNFEVILVDDGSTDGMLSKLIQTFDLLETNVPTLSNLKCAPIHAIYKSSIDDRLTVIHKENAKSKADAMNCGVNFARYRYLCCVDGDTMYITDALLSVMSEVIRDPKEIIGCTSFFGISRAPENAVRVSHRAFYFDWHWLSGLQHIDLMRSFLVYRMALCEIGAMMCNPGAFAIWRKDIFLEMDGYDSRFSCEDIEFTFRVHEHFLARGIPYKVLSLPKLVAWTEGPDSICSLIKQRARWQRVLLETIWHYRKMFLNPTYKMAGIVGMPYYVLFEALAPLMQMASALSLTLSFFFGLLSAGAYLQLLLALMFISAIPSAAAFIIDNRKHRNYRINHFLALSIYSLIDFFLFKPIILYSGIKGTVDFLKGKKGWDKFERNQRNQ